MSCQSTDGPPLSFVPAQVEYLSVGDMTKPAFVTKWAERMSRKACSCCSSDESVRATTEQWLQIIVANLTIEQIDTLDAELTEADRLGL